MKKKKKKIMLIYAHVMDLNYKKKNPKISTLGNWGVTIINIILIYIMEINFLYCIKNMTSCDLYK